MRQATASNVFMENKLGLRARNREIDVLKCFEKKKEHLSPSNALYLGRWDVEKLTEIDIHEIGTVFGDLRAAGYIEVAPGYKHASSWLYELTEEGQAVLDTFIEVTQPEILKDAETLYAYIYKYYYPDTHHWIEFNMTQYRPEHQARFEQLLEELQEQGQITYNAHGRSFVVDVRSEIDKNAVGYKVFRRRVALNLTLSELAENADVPSFFLDKLERDELDEKVDADVMLRIAEALDTTIADLYGLPITRINKKGTFYKSVENTDRK